MTKGRIPVVILSGCVLAAALGFFLFQAKDLSPGYVKLHTFLDDAEGLMDGTQVRLNGIPVGYLDAQKLTNSRDPQRKVRFDLHVKESYLRDIPADSQVGLASDNLLGEQYIGIRRGKSAQHIQPGDELRTMQSQDITRLMAQMSTQLDRLQAIATRADKLISGAGKGRGDIGKLAQEGAGVSGELNRLVEDIQHGHGTLAKLLYDDPLDAQLQAPLKRLDAIMSSVDGTSTQLKEFKDGLDRASGEYQTLQAAFKAGRGSFARFDQLQAQFDELTYKINGMMDKINSGQGTIGQLMVNPQLNQALDGATREFQELAKGLQANPMKFVRIRIF